MSLLYLALCLSFGLGSFDNPAQDIIGTWEFVSAKVTDTNGVVTNYTSHDLRSHKILNAGYFCVVTRNADGSFRHTNLGPYRIEGNLYIETVEYSTNSGWIGSRPEYAFTVESDIWIIRTTGVGKESREETWRRIEDSRFGAEF